MTENWKKDFFFYEIVTKNLKNKQTKNTLKPPNKFLSFTISVVKLRTLNYIYKFIFFLNPFPNLYLVAKSLKQEYAVRMLRGT